MEENKYICSFKSGNVIRVDQQTIDIIGQRIISPEGAKKFQVFHTGDNGHVVLVVNIEEIESIAPIDNTKHDIKKKIRGL